MIIMKRYSAYKDSGIEWIGQIPNDWKTKKLKYMLRNFDGRRVPLSSEQRAEMRGEYPYYGSNGIVDHVNSYLFDGEFILLGEDGAPFFEAYKDVAFLVCGRFWVNNHAHILKANLNYCQRFLTYLLNRVDYRRHITGSTRDKLTQDDMSSIKLPVAEQCEQEAIADYLDRKTAQIDDLIAKKEKVIELLKEERTAVINQVVTKGLDLQAEMKDSGIEWLGKIPKHWEIKRLKYVANINPQRANGISDETKVVFIAMESMNADGTYDNSIVRSYLEVKSGFTYFAEEDVIFAKITPCFENGKGALLHNLGMPIGFGSTEFHVLRAVKNKTIPEYLYFLAISGVFRVLGEASMQGVAGQKRVTSDFVRDFIIGVPLVNEQTKISVYLKDKIKKIDTQIVRENKSIEYLKEYRTALISEVVTGKICLC